MKRYNDDYYDHYSVGVPAPQPTADPAPRTGMETGVWVPVAQNAFGGLGVMGVVAIVLFSVLITRGMGILEALRWAAITGLFIGALVFFAACAVRAFRDEVHDMLAFWGARQDQAARKALAAELASTRAELKEYQSAHLVSSRYSAEATAERLLRMAYEEKQSITRDACLCRGMRRPDWEAAAKLLRQAGVMDGKGKLLAADYAGAWAAVLRRVRSAEGHYVRTADGDWAKS